MHLVHVTTVPLTFRFFEGQLEYMVERGWEIHAISSPGERLDELAQKQGVTSHAVELSRAITPLRDLWSLGEMAATIRGIDPDIVHGHTPKGGLLAMLSAAAVGVEHRVYTIRGLPFVTMEGWNRRLMTATERISCALADRVVAVSDSLRAVAVEEEIVRPEKIRVLAHGSSNGVDAEGTFDPEEVSDERAQSIRREYGMPEKATVVGFVGRLVRDKGVEQLVDAWEGTLETHPGARLLVCGPKGERDAISEETYRRMEVDDTIHLAGFVDDMPAHYAAMDLVAFPSHREGFPNVPLEAAAMELPVVAADAIGSVDAVVDGATGTIVPVGDARALERAIEAYLTDPGLRRRHGKNGRERVLKHFRPDGIWSELAELYEELLVDR